MKIGAAITLWHNRQTWPVHAQSVAASKQRMIESMSNAQSCLGALDKLTPGDTDALTVE